MLKEQKEFEDDYILDTDKFFSGLKQEAKVPIGKVILLFLVPTILLIMIIVTAIYLVK